MLGDRRVKWVSKLREFGEQHEDAQGRCEIKEKGGTQVGQELDGCTTFEISIVCAIEVFYAQWCEQHVQNFHDRV